MISSVVNLLYSASFPRFKLAIVRLDSRTCTLHRGFCTTHRDITVHVSSRMIRVCASHGRFPRQRAANVASGDERYLPLTGVSSIIGRSVVLKRGADNSNWVCANIEQIGGFKIRAVAKFTGILTGEITFTQVDDLPTAISVRLRHQRQSLSSDSHNWHVHESPVQGDGQSAIGRCQSAGPHYNPSKVNVSEPGYSQRCSGVAPLTCELGDLSGKHRPLRLAGLQQAVQQSFFSDDFLPLSGRFSGEFSEFGECFSQHKNEYIAE